MTEPLSHEELEFQIHESLARIADLTEYAQKQQARADSAEADRERLREALEEAYVWTHAPVTPVEAIAAIQNTIRAALHQEGRDG